MGLSWKNIWQSNYFFMRMTVVNHSKLQRAPSSWRGELSESRVFPQGTQGQEMRQWAFPGQTHINLTFEFEWGFFFFIFLFIYSHLIYYIQTAAFFPSCLPRSFTPLPHLIHSSCFSSERARAPRDSNLNTSGGDQSYYNLNSISDHVTEDKSSSLLVWFPHPWTSSPSPFSFLLPSHVLHCCEAWRR